MGTLHSDRKLQEQTFMTGLYEEYERLLFYVAGQCTSDLFEQEEIVQTALLQLLSKEETLKGLPPRTLASYLGTTVRNTAISYRRKQEKARGQEVPLEDAAEVEETRLPTLDALLIRTENRAALLDAFHRLREEDRLLLTGKYILHQSDDELAQQLQCKPESIRTKRFRARKRFLTLLQKGGVFDE